MDVNKNKMIDIPDFLTQGIQDINLAAIAADDSDQEICVNHSSCTLDACNSYAICTQDGGCTDTCPDCNDTCPDNPVVRPSFTISAITSSSVMVTVTPTSSYAYYRIMVRLANDPNDVTYNQEGIYAGSTFSRTVTGLASSTQYLVNVGYNDNGGASWQWIGSRSFTTAGNPRPSSWQWTSTVSVGSPFMISAQEWRNFCDRINAFRAFKGLGAYSFSNVSSGQAVSATIVNQARTAINAVSTHGTLPPQIVSGDTITAYVFNQLRIALNAIT